MDAEKEAAKKLLSYVENELADALRIYEETHDNVRNCGYDLRPEGMKAVTSPSMSFGQTCNKRKAKPQAMTPVMDS
ncbi:MAG: hypothetical protein IJ048_02645 [Clostridia bacterium]|nr:hypothetical protein [Clostridia bacterium]